VRSATDPDPVSVSPADPLRSGSRKGRVISLVDRYHAEHKARLARMGGACSFSHPGNLEAALRLIVREEPEPPQPVIRPVVAEYYYPNMWFWDLLSHRCEPSDRCPPVNRIIDMVAFHFDVTAKDMISARRDKGVIIPRQIAMYLARMLTLRSLPQIGRAFGDRDHTTVLHSINKVNQYIATCQMGPVIEELTKRIMA
jgi:hypothetical protein